MITERPHITIQELPSTTITSPTWSFSNITEEQWITGSHEELQQRILVLLDQARRGYEIEQEYQQRLTDNQYKDDIIEDYREREARTRRLRANKAISANHKMVLMHIEDEAGRLRPELTDQIRIDMSAAGRATGLSRYTVGDKVRDLANWGAIAKTVEKVKVEKKGKKIEVDHVSVALNEMFLIAPEDIHPLKDGEEYDRNHGGHRERCRRCKSKNIKRLHHIRCFNCGDEYICTPEGETQEILLSVGQDAPRINALAETSVSQDATRIVDASMSQDAPRITSEVDSIRESNCYSDTAASMSQVATPITPVSMTETQTASLSLSPSTSSLEETLNDTEADFWTRWRALTGENNLNETARKHIQELAANISSTQDLQTLYDLAYDRLEEFAKSQGKKAVPPRLGNLVKCLPDWKQAQKRRDQERAEKEQTQEHIPGTGQLTNWTEKRMKGEDVPPLVYTRLDLPPAARTKRSTPSGGLSRATLNDLPKRQDAPRKEHPNGEKS